MKLSKTKIRAVDNKNKKLFATIIKIKTQLLLSLVVVENLILSENLLKKLKILVKGLGLL